MQFNFDNVGFSKKKMEEVGETSGQCIALLRSLCRDFSYTREESAVALAFDEKFASQSIKLAQQFKDVELIIVIGIGGSNLGAQAITEAILGKYYNLLSTKKIMWADSIDPASLTSIKTMARKTPPEKTLLIVISKSGTTMEIIANFQVLFTSKVNIVVITDVGSKLAELAALKEFHLLEIPIKVAGRYSVFSNVGLFPLSLAGIDVKKLLKGARKGCEESLCLDVSKSPAFASAAGRFLHHKKGIRINEGFYFPSNFEGIGKWWRQLLSESIGKEKNLRGEKVNEGITPVVSTAVDLHSQAQLYFGGENNRLFEIVNVEKKFDFAIPPLAGFDALVPEIQGKKTSQVSMAILNGFKKALVHYKRPFTEVTLANESEEEIGEYMQVKMIETILLAHLLGVNAFDQPEVEHYKLEAKKHLREVKGL